MNIQDVKWCEVKYLVTSAEGPASEHKYAYKLLLPEFLAKWDVWEYWERERINSMAKHLKKGDITFDIGAEVGWMSVILAQIVGAENMVLVEPTPEFWPNIKYTWQKNFDRPPLACFTGLLGNRKYMTGENNFSRGWPPIVGDELVEKMAYRYIHNNEQLKERKDPRTVVPLDLLVQKSGIVPDALTIDIEGAEKPMLQGARQTLKQYRPKVWVSIHPDLALRDYNVEPDETVDFMRRLNYIPEYLATDHEEHWYFRPAEERSGRT